MRVRILSAGTQNAKLLEEERLNEERERSSSDVASPSSDAASPRSPDASVPSTHTPDPPSTPASATTDTPTVELASTPAAPTNTPATEPQLTPASAASDQPLVEPASAPATPTSAQPTPLALDASTRVQPGTPGEAEDAYNTPAAQSDHDHAPDPAGGVDAPPADAPAPEDGIRDTPTSTTEHAQGLGKKPHSKLLLEAISNADSDEKPIISETDKKSEKGESDSNSKESSASEQGKDINDESSTSKKESGDVKGTSSEDRGRNTGESSSDPESSESGEMQFMNPTGTDEKASEKDKSIPLISEEKNEHSLPTSSDKKSATADSGVKDSEQSQNPCENSIDQTVPPESGAVPGLLTPIDDNRRFQTTPSSSRFPNKSHKRSSFSEAKEIYCRPPTRFETMNYLLRLSAVQCLQRAYGAAKTNKVTGCAVSCMELGMYVAIMPAVLFARVCDAPLLCADKVISKSVGSVARVLSCVPNKDSCGIPGCSYKDPVVCAVVDTQRKN
ncbi:Protein of unknown function [Gryllus bimaculatus]|nr:Protein of unknown function [Gryllus bimaculatus]